MNFTCTNCTADLSAEDNQRFITCGWCRRQIEVPRLTQIELDSFTRANRQRQNKQFAEAEKNYQLVLNAHPQDHEALWGLVLCHYGIVFVKENDEIQPTCWICRPLPFLDHSDFKHACQLAPEEIRMQYERDAQYICTAQREIWRHESSTPPYDIFLCYKHSVIGDPDARTRDSYLAEKLHRTLSRRGYRVFFAPVDTQNRLGAHYEAIIYHALKTAKVMLTISTRPEHLECNWPKSEWNRFVDMMDHGADKRLIPLFQGMSAEELPQTFRNHGWQGLCLEGNYEKTLLRNLENCLPRRRSFRTPALALIAVCAVLMFWAGASLLNRPDDKDREAFNPTAEQTTAAATDTETPVPKVTTPEATTPAPTTPAPTTPAPTTPKPTTQITSIQQNGYLLTAATLYSNYNSSTSNIKAYAKNTAVTVLEAHRLTNDELWYKVKIDSYTGYVKGTAVALGDAPTPTPSPTPTTQITSIHKNGYLTRGTYMYKAASVTSDTMIYCRKDSTICVLELHKLSEGINWYKVEYNNRTGFIRESAIKLGTSPTTATSTKSTPNSQTDDFKYELVSGTYRITDYNGNATTLKIPTNINGIQVTGIGDRAFDNCNNLTSITIPSSIISIGNGAFRYCRSLKSVSIADGVKIIGATAFYGCTNLTAIYIPDSVLSIGYGAFSDCSALTIHAPRNSYAIHEAQLFRIPYAYTD